jgi:hypothetical protein
MQDNEPATCLTRAGDDQNPEAAPAGCPGTEASTGDSRPAAEAASPGADREAWLESYKAAVAGLQQRNRAYLADRARGLARELEAEAANPSHWAPQADGLLMGPPPAGRGHAEYETETGS